MTVEEELVRLELPALPAFVVVGRTVVVAVASTLPGIDDDRLEDLRIAVSEACTNAVEAHLAGGGEDRIVLRCVTRDGSLEVHIEDSGPGFEVDAADTASDDPSRLRAERGWGLQLIRALVDDVEFDQGEAGASVRLIVRLDGEDQVGDPMGDSNSDGS